MSRLGRAVLRLLSSPPESNNDRDTREGYSTDELARLKRRIPGVPTMIRGCAVLDYGCGAGREVAQMAKLGAKSIVGVDINEELLEQARQLARSEGVTDRVNFTNGIDDELHSRFDVVLSRNAMVHYTQPRGVLDAIARVMRPSGRAVVVFGPPWLHPYGAHVRYFAPVPWPQIWFSEDTVMEVRSDYRDDGAERFEEVTGGLNRMTLSRFESLVRQSPLEFEFLDTVGIRRGDCLTSIPIIRECVTTSVHAVLRGSTRPDPAFIN